MGVYVYALPVLVCVHILSLWIYADTYNVSAQADKTKKKNCEIRVEIWTKIKSGKAYILTIFISVSLSTVINALTICA
jgi:hypothetical protein